MWTDVKIVFTWLREALLFGGAGRRGVRADAARGGQTEEAYLLQLGELLTLEMAASALVDLVRAEPATTARAYLFTAAQLHKLP